MNRKIPRSYTVLHAELIRLRDSNPAAAVCKALAIPDGQRRGAVRLDSLKAIILVDAGLAIRDSAAVSKGVELLRDLAKRKPAETHFLYNLGNGLIGLADLVPNLDASWYLATAAKRQEARKLFQRSVAVRAKDGPTSVAFANLGGALGKAHRWVEAYDAYSNALEVDPTNAFASLRASQILLRCVKRGLGSKDILLGVAAKHLQSANQNPKRIRELAGPQAYKVLSRQLKRKIWGGGIPDLSKASGYVRFVARNRLALSPTIEGLDLSLKRWDSLAIASVIESAKGQSGIPPIFGMFNVLKADYLLARSLAYEAISVSQPPDSGSYFDTLDYANYGVTSAKLVLAQRACIDLLDKIACATAEYFSIPGNPKKVYFSTSWFQKQDKESDPLLWQPALMQEIQGGNSAIIALSEVSLDIRMSGFLADKKKYRHGGTHRFVILHDLSDTPSRPSAYIDHCLASAFEAHLIESLQLARAAMFYFVEMISISVAMQSSRPGVVMPMIVPTHHWIRGEDEDRA